MFLPHTHTRKLTLWGNRCANKLARLWWSLHSLYQKIVQLHCTYTYIILFEFYFSKAINTILKLSLKIISRSIKHHNLRESITYFKLKVLIIWISYCGHLSWYRRIEGSLPGIRWAGLQGIGCLAQGLHWCFPQAASATAVVHGLMTYSLRFASFGLQKMGKKARNNWMFSNHPRSAGVLPCSYRFIDNRSYRRWVPNFS